MLSKDSFTVMLGQNLGLKECDRLYKINGNMLLLCSVLIIASAVLVGMGRVQWDSVSFIWCVILAFYFGNQRGLVKADNLERNPALLKSAERASEARKQDARYGERVC